jgi:hypothetical protein
LGQLCLINTFLQKQDLDFQFCHLDVIIHRHLKKSSTF